MDISSVILGSVGMLATLATSVAGLYFTHKARTAPFRELLFSRQFDAVIHALQAYSNLRDRMVALFGPHDDIGAHDAIWHEVRRAADDIAALGPISVIVFPSPLYRSFCAMHEDALSILRRIAYDDLPRSELDRLIRHGDNFASMARTFLGVDSLSEENRGNFLSIGKDMSNSLSTPTLPRRAPEAV